MAYNPVFVANVHSPPCVLPRFLPSIPTFSRILRDLQVSLLDMIRNNSPHTSAASKIPAGSSKPIDLTVDDVDPSALLIASSGGSEPATPTRTLAKNLVTLHLGPQQNHTSSSEQSSLKRRTDDDCGSSSQRDVSLTSIKRHRRNLGTEPRSVEWSMNGESRIEMLDEERIHTWADRVFETRDSVDLTSSIGGPSTPSEVSGLRRLSFATISSDESGSDIEILTDSETESVVTVATASSDDEVQIISERRCPKPKSKMKICQILDPSRKYLDEVKIKGMVINKGRCIEFHDGTFMQLRTIYADEDHGFILLGPIFTRVTTFEIHMPKTRDSLSEWKATRTRTARLPRYYRGSKLYNEVCQRIKTPVGEAEDDKGIWRRRARDVKRLRTLLITNQDYHVQCLTVQKLNRGRSISKGRRESLCRRRRLEAPLICRWKETIVQDEYGKIREHRFERPSSSEASQNFTPEDDLRKAWRGSTQNLAIPGAIPDMVDGFCGAGGMTCAAEQAGIHVKMAFDFDGKKIATHILNFPNCYSMQLDVFEFIRWAEKKGLKIDILHLSPPCQPFSPANTTPNEAKNEVNQAALLSVGLVIKCLRPRVVTIEESAGITGRHTEWFGALINQFTELGFSVRWACLNCSEYGVPQLRKRFFLIASW